MRNKSGVLELSLSCSALFATGAFAADTASIGEPGRSAGGKNPLQNPKKSTSCTCTTKQTSYTCSIYRTKAGVFYEGC